MYKNKRVQEWKSGLIEKERVNLHIFLKDTRNREHYTNDSAPLFSYSQCYVILFFLSLTITALYYSEVPLCTCHMQARGLTTVITSLRLCCSTLQFWFGELLDACSESNFLFALLVSRFSKTLLDFYKTIASHSFGLVNMFVQVAYWFQFGGNEYRIFCLLIPINTYKSCNSGSKAGTIFYQKRVGSYPLPKKKFFLVGVEFIIRGGGGESISRPCTLPLPPLPFFSPGNMLWYEQNILQWSVYIRFFFFSSG